MESEQWFKTSHGQSRVSLYTAYGVDGDNTWLLSAVVEEVDLVVEEVMVVVSHVSWLNMAELRLYCMLLGKFLLNIIAWNTWWLTNKVLRLFEWPVC